MKLINFFLSVLIITIIHIDFSLAKEKEFNWNPNLKSAPRVQALFYHICEERKNLVDSVCKIEADETNTYLLRELKKIVEQSGETVEEALAGKTITFGGETIPLNKLTDSKENEFMEALGILRENIRDNFPEGIVEHECGTTFSDYDQKWEDCLLASSIITKAREEALDMDISEVTHKRKEVKQKTTEVTHKRKEVKQKTAEETQGLKEDEKGLAEETHGLEKDQAKNAKQAEVIAALNALKAREDTKGDN